VDEDEPSLPPLSPPNAPPPPLVLGLEPIVNAAAAAPCFGAPGRAALPLDAGEEVGINVVPDPAPSARVAGEAVGVKVAGEVVGVKVGVANVAGEVVGVNVFVVPALAPPAVGLPALAPSRRAGAVSVAAAAAWPVPAGLARREAQRRGGWLRPWLFPLPGAEWWLWWMG